MSSNGRKASRANKSAGAHASGDLSDVRSVSVGGEAPVLTAPPEPEDAASDLQREIGQLPPFLRAPIYLPTDRVPVQDAIAGVRRVRELYESELDSTYRPRLRALKEGRQARRCFVIGNGPSLRRTDLTKLRGEVTFATNGFFLMIPELGWAPTYYVVEDHLVAEDRKTEIEELEGPVKLFPASLRYVLDPDDSTIYFDHRPRQSFPHGFDFSFDADIYTYTGGTVTYTCLQLAAYLGFEEIYLVGVDADYSIPSDASLSGNGRVKEIDMESDDPNHFHPDYFGKGKRWHEPNVEVMLGAYAEARRACQGRGIAIANATVGGKLEVFRRVEFDSLFMARFPRALVVDHTRMADGTATGELKATLFKEWPEGRLMQIYDAGQGRAGVSGDGISTMLPIDKPEDRDALLGMVRSFSPDVVLYRPVPRTAKFHATAMEIIRALDAPVIAWIVDDWPAEYAQSDPDAFLTLDEDWHWLLRRASAHFAISDQMADAFQSRYGVKFHVFANGIDPGEWAPVQKRERRPLRVRFAGSLARNMGLDTIVTVAQAIESSEIAIQFEIKTRDYWFMTSGERFDGLSRTRVIVADFSDDHYREWLSDADIVLIAYNFDEVSVEYVRYSIANKLPECLASGAALLAIGPEVIATMQLVESLDCGVRVHTSDVEAVQAALTELALSGQLRYELGLRGQAVAARMFDVHQIRDGFREVVSRVAARDQLLEPFRALASLGNGHGPVGSTARVGQPVSHRPSILASVRRRIQLARSAPSTQRRGSRLVRSLVDRLKEAGAPGLGRPTPHRPPSVRDGETLMAAPGSTMKGVPTRPIYADFGDWLLPRSPRTYRLLQRVRRIGVDLWRRRRWVVPTAALATIWVVAGLVGFGPLLMIWGTLVFLTSSLVSGYVVLQMRHRAEAERATTDELARKMADIATGQARAVEGLNAAIDSLRGQNVSLDQRVTVDLRELRDVTDASVRHLQALQSADRDALHSKMIETQAGVSSHSAEIQSLRNSAASMDYALRAALDQLTGRLNDQNDGLQVFKAESTQAIQAESLAVKAELVAYLEQAANSIEAEATQLMQEVRGDLSAAIASINNREQADHSAMRLALSDASEALANRHNALVLSFKTELQRVVRASRARDAALVAQISGARRAASERDRKLSLRLSEAIRTAKSGNRALQSSVAKDTKATVAAAMAFTRETDATTRVDLSTKIHEAEVILREYIRVVADEVVQGSQASVGALRSDAAESAAAQAHRFEESLASRTSTMRVELTNLIDAATASVRAEIGSDREALADSERATRRALAALERHIAEGDATTQTHLDATVRELGERMDSNRVALEVLLQNALKDQDSALHQRLNDAAERADAIELLIASTKEALAQASVAATDVLKQDLTSQLEEARDWLKKERDNRQAADVSLRSELSTAIARSDHSLRAELAAAIDRAVDIARRGDEGTEAAFEQLLGANAAALRDQIKLANDEIAVALEANLTALTQRIRRFEAFQMFNRDLTPAHVDTLVAPWKKRLNHDMSKTSLPYVAHRIRTIESGSTGRLATQIEDAVLRVLVSGAVRRQSLEVLEIGTLFGIGATIIYDYARNRFKRVHLTVVDPLDGYYGDDSHDPLLNLPVNQEIFWRNVDSANVPRKDVELILARSYEDDSIRRAAQRKYDLLVIDADHTYAGVKSDLDNYLGFVRRGGYILFDDYNTTDWPDVRRFVDDEAMNHPSLALVGTEWRTAVFRVIKAPVE